MAVASVPSSGTVRETRTIAASDASTTPQTRAAELRNAACAFAPEWK